MINKLKKIFSDLFENIAILNDNLQNFLNANDYNHKKNIHDVATSGPLIRSQFLRVAFIIGFSIILFRVAQIALFRKVDIARTTAIAEAKNQGKRADIIDRNGVLLATSLTGYSLFADPEKVWDPKETAQALLTVFPEMNANELERKLGSNKRFVWIKRRLTPAQKQKVWALAQPGLEFQEESLRIYPLGTLAGHVLGGLNSEGKGLTGLELAFDSFLNATKDLEPVRISIDSRIQYIVEKELSEAAVKFGAKGGVAAIMDVKTGEMIAAASWPVMNPNNFGANTPYAIENRLVSSVYEMGSTFKAFTFAAAINDGVITPDTQFDTSRPLKIGNFSINDAHGLNKIISAREVLEHSSNIGTALISKEVGAQRLKEFFDELSLTKRVSGELLGGGYPILPKRWGLIQSITASYGHGIAVTPLSVLAAYTAITNGGIYIRPTFLARDKNIPVGGKRIITQEASKTIVSLLSDVVNNGTGTAAQAQYYKVAGKTGTAEKATKTGYDKTRNLTSFAAVFPADNPRYTLLFLLDEPQAIGNGGRTAAFVTAPSVSKIITRIGPMLDLPINKQLLLKNQEKIDNKEAIPPNLVANNNNANIQNNIKQ